MRERITENTLHFSREEFKFAERRAHETNLEIVKFRNTSGSIGHHHETNRILDIIINLENQLTGTHTT